MAPEDLAVEHPRQKDIVGKLRLPDALGAGIDLAKRFANDVEWSFVIAVLCHLQNQTQMNTDLHRLERAGPRHF
jgi:hypothetical protein